MTAWTLWQAPRLIPEVCGSNLGQRRKETLCFCDLSDIIKQIRDETVDKFSGKLFEPIGRSSFDRTDQQVDPGQPEGRQRSGPGFAHTSGNILIKPYTSERCRLLKAD